MKDENLSIKKSVATIAVLPFLVALEGWVISTMWAWFAVPLGVPGIGVAHAAGISLLWSAFSAAPPKSDEKIAKLIMKNVLRMTTILCFGWLAHAIM